MPQGKPSSRPRVGALVVVALLGGGLAYEMAVQSPPLMSTASAAALPQEVANRIGTDPGVPSGGNPVGTVSVVEFFDYRCPYCRTMQTTLDALTAKDRRVRLVYKEWPIFGGASVTAARVALAAGWQGKYAAVHEALFKLPRTMDEAAIRMAAGNAGVDMAHLDRDLAARSGGLDAALARVDVEARMLGFQGTPGFVVGRLVAPGAVPAAEMDKLVERAARGR